MNIYILTILIFSISFSQHFVVDIEETGSSTLFVFQNSISTLSSGDEVGLFDNAGIINSEGNIGELLVGSGTWTGDQLEVVTVQGLDLSQFGGPILPGSNQGNSMTVKLWDVSIQEEHTVTYEINSGSGDFDGLFTAIEQIHYESNSDGGISDGCDLPENNFYLNDGNVLYNSSYDIGGFQFSVDGTTISGASGGDAAAAGS